MAASFADGDRNPPRFDPATHSAPLPDAFKKSYAQFMASEFWRLDLTPAAIAARVRTLEEELGATLIKRVGRGVKATEAGLKVLEQGAQPGTAYYLCRKPE